MGVLQQLPCLAQSRFDVAGAHQDLKMVCPSAALSTIAIGAERSQVPPHRRGPLSHRPNIDQSANTASSRKAKSAKSSAILAPSDRGGRDSISLEGVSIGP